MMDFACSYTFWYVLFHVHLVFLDVSFLNGSYTTVMDGENLPRMFIIPKND